MTESLLEQTALNIVEKHGRGEFFKREDLAGVTAILTQYTEEVLGKMDIEVTEESFVGADGLEWKSSENDPDMEVRNDLRKEQFLRAGLSHGEKEQE